MNPLSPELAQRIQRHLTDLPNQFGAWPVRLSKKKLNALPLHGDQIYLWALRPDGVVLCLDHESASLTVREESDPLTLYAVLVQGAQKYPELQELVPPRPLGVRQCEPCSGTGVIVGAETTTGCMRCRGLGWHVILRPIDEWIERIDRGDQLTLWIGNRQLIAGRLAGLYVVKADDAYWSNPANASSATGARHHLRERLASFQTGKHVNATWRENLAETDDPFESTEYKLVSQETGSGGSCTVEFTRRPDGEYDRTTALNNDWDLSGSEPTIQTEKLSETEARAELENQMRRRGFPAVVKGA
jgi:hypothetical protein